LGRKQPESTVGPRKPKSGNKPDALAIKEPAQPSAAVDKTLTKGLQLLEALSEGEESRGISELALQLSLTKSVSQRVKATGHRAADLASTDDANLHERCVIERFDHRPSCCSTHLLSGKPASIASMRPSRWRG
jgi:hypothetical protein